MEELIKIRNLLKNFIEYVSSNISDTKNSNLLQLSIAEVIEYLNFLEIIFIRYLNTSQTFLEKTKIQLNLMQKTNESHTLSDEEYSLFSEINSLQKELRLEMESFYLFAHILLTKSTNFPNRYFLHKYRKSLNFGSHEQFWKSLRKSTEFTLPKDLISSADWLKEKVGDYRDKLITHTLQNEHFNRLLIKGITFSQDGAIKMHHIKLYPENDEMSNKDSEILEDIIEVLSKYFDLYLKFLLDNKSKSILI